MESAPSLQADSNASEFKSPHCIPVSTSGAIFQMELSDCQQGSHQLLNSLGSLGGPHNNECWCMETSAASNCKWKWHPPPPTISGAMNWSHTCPYTIYGTIHPHLAALTYGALSPTTYPSLQVSAAFSAFSLQVHHTSDHSLQVQGANGHTSEPSWFPHDHCK